MIFVIGATGTLGSEVVNRLKESGAQFKVAASSPEKVEKERQRGQEAVLFDFNRPETFAPALQGIDKLFLLSPPGATHLEAGVIDEAKQAGIKHIVKQSALNAPTEEFAFARGHRASEKQIEASGIPYTFLRPNGFMQNYVTNFGESIKNQGAFQLPMADARVSYIDVRDIAAVAAEALTNKGHENKAYTLTGPESLSNFDVAEKLSHAIGKEITYVPVRDEDMRNAMKGMGAPDAMIEALLELMHNYVAGKAAAVTSDVEQVTKRKPNSFDHFAKDYAPAFTETAAAD